jgi:hypothetical protein
MNKKMFFFLISINLYNRLPGKSSKELDDVVNYNWSVSKESVKECDYSTTQPRDFLYHDKKRKRRRLKYAAEKHTSDGTESEKYPQIKILQINRIAQGSSEGASNHHQSSELKLNQTN